MRRNGLHFTTGDPGLVITPTHLRLAVFERDHCDAVVHGADQRAEIAGDAVFLADLGDGFAGHSARAEAVAVRVHQINALVRAVFAGDVTEIAADALVIIDARN